MYRWIILVLFLPLPVHAQVTQIDAGVGSLFANGSMAEGAEGTLYLPNSVLRAGAAYENGQFLGGASDERVWRNWDTTLGYSSLGVSTEGVGVGIALVGASLQRKTPNGQITVFAGMTGIGFSALFLGAVVPQHLGTGILFQHKFFTSLTLTSLGVINGGQKTLAEGASYNWHRAVKMSGTVGLMDKQKFAMGTVSVRPSEHLNFYGSHSQYFSPYQATANSLGGSLIAGRFNLGANLNESVSLGHTITGESLSSSIRLGSIQEREGIYRSGGRTIWTHSGIETFRHLSISQTVTQSGGQNSLSVGGGYTSNRLSGSVSHSIQFILNGGYESVTSISVSVRIRDLVLGAQTVTTPFGKTLYEVSSENYIQTGIQVPEGHVTYASGGKFLISGMCKLDDGTPVNGCAVQIGKSLVYSNASGKFDTRVKKNKAVIITVDVSEFSTPGAWKVIESPKSATPETEIAIIVERF